MSPFTTATTLSLAFNHVKIKIIKNKNWLQFLKSRCFKTANIEILSANSKHRSYLFQSAACRKCSTVVKRAARRSVSVEMLFYCCTNNANRSRVSLSSTFSNCHVLFGYLHSTRNRASCMRCRACHQQTSIQTILLMSSGP